MVSNFSCDVIWILPWKGITLWKAARLNDKRWFIAILVMNTLGLLEIFFTYFLVSGKHKVGNFCKNKIAFLSQIY